MCLRHLPGDLINTITASGFQVRRGRRVRCLYPMADIQRTFHTSVPGRVADSSTHRRVTADLGIVAVSLLNFAGCAGFDFIDLPGLVRKFLVDIRLINRFMARS